MQSTSFADIWQANQACDVGAENRLMTDVIPRVALTDTSLLRKKAAENQLLTDVIPRIAGLVRKLLRNRSQWEDVKQSVLVSFLANHREAVAKVASPDELWQLFAAIALRHCGKHNKRGYRAGKRGPVVRVRSAATDESGSPSGYVPVDAGPPPDVEAALIDLFAACNKRLTDRQQKVLAQLRAGADRKDVAKLLNISIPTVDRELQKIRNVLAELSGESDE